MATFAGPSGVPDQVAVTITAETVGGGESMLIVPGRPHAILRLPSLIENQNRCIEHH
jgi:hypothetical protein